ncbi:MAG: PorV/PorQ family protein [Candidatus Eisenbacteria bacterium]|nr:PorV/PorQ family protein [Candidatus Eisenbacteria bacterium]
MFRRGVFRRSGIGTAALALAGACGLTAPATAMPSGFAFLEVPAGARASALGGAVVSSGSGVEAAFWNPAGLATIEGVEIGGSHDESFDHLRHDRFAVAGRQLGGGIALAVRALYTQPIEARDDLGNVTGTFGGHDLEFALGYGRTLTAGVRAGLSAEIVRERIADLSTGTWSLGAGIGYAPPSAPALTLGLAVDHLGPDAHYTFADGPGQPVPLPAGVQAGGTYAFGLGGAMGLAASLEARAARGRALVGMMGAELSHPSGAALRLGLRVNDSASSVSMGAGYGSRALHLDYAFVPYRLDLGDTHRVSFTARF